MSDRSVCGFVQSCDRGFVRVVPGELTSGGYRLAVHLAGRGDVSPIYRGSYVPVCGWCWLGAPHSVDAHDVSVAK